jgi:GNAT superfamily N-acetyltransferase
MIIRDYTHDDRNFILATWLRGLYYGDVWFKRVPKSIFMLNYHKILVNILARPNIKIKVACLKDETSVILGYAVLHDRNLDWVFVKSAWRNIGIAKKLVPTDIEYVTHLTKSGTAILESKLTHVEFNPFI